MAAIDTLMIACMDYRLNERVNEALQSGRVAVLRNAGSDAAAYTENIRDALKIYPSINRVSVVVHDNGCGGMKVAFGVNREHDPKLAAYNERFRGLDPAVKKSKNQKELEERENPAFQVEMLKELLAKHFEGRRMSVDSELVHVPEKSHAEHFLLVTRDLVTDYDKLRADYSLEPKDAYVIHYSSIKEALPDISIGVNVLGLTKIKCMGVSMDEFMNITDIAGTKANVSILSQSRSKSTNRISV